jgi:hypothetical protein
LLTGAPPTAGLVALTEGRLTEARALFWSEADAAERREDGQALAEAALGLGGLWVHENRATLEGARVLALQRKALAGIDGSSVLAQRLRTRVAAEHAYTSGEIVGILAALHTARSGGEPVVVAEGLSLAHHCVLGPHYGPARLAMADELIAVAATTGRELDGLMGLSWRTVDLFLAGDRRARRSLGELRNQLQVQRCDAVAYLVAALEVMLAVRSGDLEGAERLAVKCRELGDDVGDADAPGWFAAQLVAIRWFQGRGNELLPLLGELDQSATVAESSPALTAGIAAVAAGAGELEIARSALARLTSPGLDKLMSSSVWMLSLMAVCEAAHALGEADAAREAYRLLEPFSDLPVMASLAIACFGSAHRPLGLAAWTMGDLDSAVRHLELAEKANLALENGPCHAMSLASLADVLEAAGHDGFVRRAVELRAQAVREATRYGMTARVGEWSGRTGPGATFTCNRQGRVWLVAVGSRTASVPHNVGMEYLGELVAHPDTAIPAVDLASSYSFPKSRRADEILDARAKAEYRERMNDLRSEIDNASDYADLERASRAKAELDALVQALVQATGLCGRARLLGDDNEKARISVRKAIMRALTMIEEADPAIANELRARVVTGAQCIFDSRTRLAN